MNLIYFFIKIYVLNFIFQELVFLFFFLVSVIDYWLLCVKFIIADGKTYLLLTCNVVYLKYRSTNLFIFVKPFEESVEVK